MRRIFFVKMDLTENSTGTEPKESRGFSAEPEIEAISDEASTWIIRAIYNPETADNHGKIRIQQTTIEQDSTSSPLKNRTPYAKGALVQMADSIGPSNAGGDATEVFLKTVSKRLEDDLSSYQEDPNIPHRMIDLLHNAAVQGSSAIDASRKTDRRNSGASILILFYYRNTVLYTWAGNLRAYLYGHSPQSRKRMIHPDRFDDSLLKPGFFARWISFFKRTFAAGDSRVLIRLTEDHSVVFDLFRKGELTEEQMGSFGNKKFVTLAAGMSESFQPPAGALRVCRGDLFLLVSDGFHFFVPSRDLNQLILHSSFVQNKDRSIEDLKILARSLMEKALENGSDDSITITLFYIR